MGHHIPGHETEEGRNPIWRAGLVKCSHWSWIHGGTGFGACCGVDAEREEEEKRKDSWLQLLSSFFFLLLPFTYER